jgi:hypothetical protein
MGREQSLRTGRFGAETMKAKVIRVDIKKTDAGFLRATSRDHAGLFVAAETRDQLLVTVPALLKDLYQAKGENVLVREAEPLEAGTLSWVVVPIGGELKETA